MAETSPISPHIAILSSPGMGHLIPLAEFAARLARDHCFSVTLITHSTGHSAAHHSIISSLPDQVTVISIPPTPTPSSSKSEARIIGAVRSSLQHHRSILLSLSLSSTAPLSALVFDFFCVDALDIAAELRVPPYILFPTNLLSLSLSFHLPTLDAAFPGKYRDLPEPVRLPGCVPLRGTDLPDPLHNRDDEAYRQFLLVVGRFREAKGFLVNSFEALEPGAVKGLKERSDVPPVYAIGPLARTSEEGDGGGGCLDWLDRQPSRSVVYVSFGSGGTLSSEQMTELALGLEDSGHRFLWVVKAPNNSEANAAFFDGDINGEMGYLPDGFISRTRGRGLVVASWLPQMKVLEHGATGGFVTHCGWNSAMESIVNGVPMVAWPLFAEQRVNAVMLTEDVKVAVRVKGTTGEEGGGVQVVERGEIAGLVRCLMEGEEGRRLRERIGVLREEAGRALGEGGSSWKAMAEVAGMWRGCTGRRS